MGYCCNYQAIIKGKVTRSLSFGACFRDIYSTIHELDQLVVYVLKDYATVGYGSMNVMNFTEDQVYQYARALMMIGFNFELETTKHTFVKSSFYNGEKSSNELECYKFTIDCKENTRNALLILVNLFRHLYEKAYVPFAEKFLEFIQEDSPVPLLDRLVMAFQTISGFAEGHTCAKAQMVRLSKGLYDDIFADETIRSTSYFPLGERNSMATSIINNTNTTLKEKRDSYIKICH